ncbi:MAG: InlB B-repeat-containing protein [Spirochaetaceae bacterium]
MRKNNALIISVILMLFFVSCELFQTQKESEYSLVNITLPSSRLLSDNIRQYDLVVSATDLGSETYTDISEETSLEILAGSDRTFTLNAYNEDKSLLLYQGVKVLDLEPGIDTPINIVISRSARTITYHDNGTDSGSVPETLYYNNNTEVVVLGNTGLLVKDTYNFDGWNTLADGSGSSYVVGSLIDIEAEDIDLYAKWSSYPTYTVLYHLDDGVGTLPTDPATYYENDDITLASSAGLTKSGYYFYGWSTSLGGSIITGAYPCPSNNVTFYAVWAVFTTGTFTNASATGAVGPTQAQLDAEYSGTSLEGYVTNPSTNDGYQLWTVPTTGDYIIEATGAQGAYNVGSAQVGANGATMVGTFSLTAGDQLIILVGQQGSISVGASSSSGGGGTFVTVIDSGSSYIHVLSSQKVTPLIIAGGGGGVGNSGEEQGVGGAITNSGTLDGGGNGTPGTSGGGGLSGTIANNNGGGGGGGFIGNGTVKLSNSGYPGYSFLNGGLGGSSRDGGSYGGFGGAGGNHESTGGGGAGGGYSGGSGGQNISIYYGGGGGGSYNTGTSPTNTAGNNSGNGSVIITLQ